MKPQSTFRRLIFQILLLVCFTLCVVGSDKEPSRATKALSTNASAFDRALEFTGFQNAMVSKEAGLNKALSSTKLIIGEDDQTPFFSALISGQDIWHIVFDSVYLDFYGPAQKDYVGRYNPKQFNVIMDPETGSLLKIYSVSLEEDTSLAPEPSAVAATAYWNDGGEVWRPANTVPPIPFYVALERAIGSNPLQAKEIIAWLVDRGTATDSTPRPYWIILGRGIPPLDFQDRSQVPIYYRNREVSIVDAVTGKLISIITPPRVGPRDTWKK